MSYFISDEIPYLQIFVKKFRVIIALCVPAGFPIADHAEPIAKRMDFSSQILPPNVN
jgi:hypothetical protein